jgi:ABC-type arginine/histidine transport system permease subunit
MWILSEGRIWEIIWKKFSAAFFLALLLICLNMCTYGVKLDSLSTEQWS